MKVAYVLKLDDETGEVLSDILLDELYGTFGIEGMDDVPHCITYYDEDEIETAKDNLCAVLMAKLKYNCDICDEADSIGLSIQEIINLVSMDGNNLDFTLLERIDMIIEEDEGRIIFYFETDNPYRE